MDPEVGGRDVLGGRAQDAVHHAARAAAGAGVDQAADHRVPGSTNAGLDAVSR